MSVKTLFTIEDFESEVRELKPRINPVPFAILETAVKELKSKTKEVKELEAKNEKLEEQIEDLEEQISDFESSEDNAAATLKIYGDHNNWKDGNIWCPLSKTIDPTNGDELASKALNRGF